MKNCGDNVFDGIPVGANEASLFGDFLAAHDSSPTLSASIHQRHQEVRPMVHHRQMANGSRSGE